MSVFGESGIHSSRCAEGDTGCHMLMTAAWCPAKWILVTKRNRFFDHRLKGWIQSTDVVSLLLFRSSLTCSNPHGPNPTKRLDLFAESRASFFHPHPEM
jgi:hypothetical protein